MEEEHRAYAEEIQQRNVIPSALQLGRPRLSEGFPFPAHESIYPTKGAVNDTAEVEL